MRGLSIALLGPPEIACDGTPIVVDTRKAIALLAYLAVEGKPQSRESLAALLWPDYEGERARASLRRTLSVLLKALGGRWVTADRRTIRLDRDAVDIDVEVFRSELRAAAAQPDLAVRRRQRAAAVERYRSDFLDGFSVRDSPEFDDWQFFTSESLRRDLAEALEALTHDCIAAEALEEAIRHARRWLTLDPLHEAAHRALMTVYAQSGQRSAALRQYRECVRTLDQELGVAPLDETQDVYRMVKENRLQPLPATVSRRSPAHAVSVTVEAPLIGREAHQEALLEGYAHAGNGWIGVVEGEAGIGKTRLAETLAGNAREQGATVVVVRCFEGEERLPFGPFVATMRDLLTDPAAEARVSGLPPSWWAEAGRMVPEFAERAQGVEPTAADSAGAQARLLDAVTGILLAGLTGDPPGLLVIDDVNWADHASRELLSYLSRRLSGAAAGILLTWRTESVPNTDPLRRLSRDAPVTVTHLALDRLARPDVDRLIDVLRPETESSTREHVWQETEGVPLFVVEYLAALAAGADLERWTVASGAGDLLAARLDGLRDASRQLVTTAAVIGRSFDFPTLRDASGRGDDETVDGIEDLLACGLLREEPAESGGEPLYDFTHHQLRSYVLAETSLARRRLLHRRVAGALADQTRRRRGTAALRAQIAWHWQQAGDDEAAAEHYLQAGEDARAVHAHAEALAHFHAALALGHPEAARLHEAIGDLHTLDGRYDDAVQHYETAAALDPDDPARLEHRLGAVHDRLGEWDIAEGHFQTALTLLRADGDVAHRARILADASLTTHRRGDSERAGDLAERALGAADEAGDPLALAQAHNLLGVLASAQGDTERAVAHLEQSLDVASAQGDLAARAGVLNNLALAHRRAGSAALGLPLVEEAVALLRQVGDRHRLAAAIGNYADLLRAAGRTAEAEARVREAVEILADIGGDEPRPEIWKLTQW